MGAYTHRGCRHPYSLFRLVLGSTSVHWGSRNPTQVETQCPGDSPSHRSPDTHLKCRAVLGAPRSHVKGGERGCLKQSETLLFQPELEQPKIFRGNRESDIDGDHERWRNREPAFLSFKRFSVIHTDPVNDTWTASAFCDEPGDQLRGPALRVSTKSAPWKPRGMFVIRFQCSPAPKDPTT